MIIHWKSRFGRTAATIPWLSLLLGAMAVPVFLSPGLTAGLECRRDAVLSGELWRLATGHWTHFSLDHLLWDLLGFVALAVVCERFSRRRLLAGIIIAALLTAGTTIACIPGLSVYRGLSGIDSALLGLMAVLFMREGIQTGDRRRVAAVAGLCLLFLGKITYEQVVGASLFVSEYGTPVVPVPLAHAAGALAGALTGLCPSGRTKDSADAALDHPLRHDGQGVVHVHRLLESVHGDKDGFPAEISNRRGNAVRLVAEDHDQIAWRGMPAAHRH